MGLLITLLALPLLQQVSGATASSRVVAVGDVHGDLDALGGTGVVPSDGPDQGYDWNATNFGNTGYSGGGYISSVPPIGWPGMVTGIRFAGLPFLHLLSIFSDSFTVPIE